jgi:hypothetical protein
MPAKVNTEARNAIGTERIDAQLKLFTARHPDWRTMEGQMVCITRKVDGKSRQTKLDSKEYLEMLYLMAKSESWNDQCPKP